MNARSPMGIKKNPLTHLPICICVEDVRVFPNVFVIFLDMCMMHTYHCNVLLFEEEVCFPLTVINVLHISVEGVLLLW